MRRRDFLSLLLLAPATAWAEDGLLIDGDVPASGLLLDVPETIVKAEKKLRVHLYSPLTWRCPHCVSAEQALSDVPEIELVLHKDDELKGFFTGKSFPILHWGSGDAWIEGWPGKEAVLKKIFREEPKTSQKQTRVVTHKGVVFHGGHDCPNCGKYQYTIENDAGPNHTHRCSSCKTSWYHADQSRFQSNGSFLFWRW